MKGNGLELWIASLTTWNFITVQNNSWMLIVHKHCAINTNLFQADTWEGSEGVRWIEVSLYNISKLNSKQVNAKRILINTAVAACFEVLFVFRLPAPLHISPFVYTKIYKPKGYKSCFTWRGWSNGGKNQNPQKSLGLPTKPPQISLDQKLTPKNPMPNFRALKISREH